MPVEAPLDIFFIVGATYITYLSLYTYYISIGLRCSFTTLRRLSASLISSHNQIPYQSPPMEALPKIREKENWHCESTEGGNQRLSRPNRF